MKRILKIVAIVVGILAAVIILATALSLISCPGLGCPDLEETPITAESALVQSAMNAMMADNGLTAIDGHTIGQAVNEWTGFPTGPGAASLDIYMKKPTTNFYYCWDRNGNLYPRSADPDDAEKPGECPQEPGCAD